ncbi:MAG: hypothetical protein ACRD8O_02460 [Bryobacteraceae bacterium]
MAAIAITDLPKDRALDRKAMSSIRGALSWVNAAFNVPVVPMPSVAPAFFQQVVNNTFYYIEEMVNHNQLVSVQNSGNNSPITAVLISSINNGGPRVQL